MPNQLFAFSPQQLMHTFAVTRDVLQKWWSDPPVYLKPALQNLLEKRAPAKLHMLTIENLTRTGMTPQEATQRLANADFPFVVRHAVAKAMLKRQRPSLREHEHEFLGEIVAHKFRKWTPRQFKSWNADRWGAYKFLDLRDFQNYEVRGLLIYDERKKYVRLTQQGSKLYRAWDERNITPRSILDSLCDRPMHKPRYEVGAKERQLLTKMERDEWIVRRPGEIYAITDAGRNALDDFRREKPDRARKTVENRFQWLALCDPKRDATEPPDDWQGAFPMPLADAPGRLPRPAFDALVTRRLIAPDPLTGCYILLQPQVRKRGRRDT